ncbi:MAG: type II toxin-antitoxin system Phd/YefM family antitoxin [Lachnospiraceae bacterium]|nr:type II toxin-antitoxin system Phd/YefM family antitoxin [Lachnospiraceae bacterium]
MSMTLLDLTERLVPISDFSQGKAGKIFNDVIENNNEYIVLKNNQPIAVLVSVEEYRDTQKRLARMESFYDKIENMRLKKIAESRINDNTTSFKSFINEQGFSMEELEELAESVEFE